MQNQPKISVILSVFNGKNYVQEAIESVLAQDYPNVELVLVNDGSTDETADILQGYLDQAIIITQMNHGLGAGRNAGIQAASGDYLSFIDHDDLWERGKLSQQMAAMNSVEQDLIVFSHVQQFVCSTLSADERSCLRVPEEPMPGFIAGTMLLSRARFNEVGEFFAINQVGEFVDWYLRAQEKQIPVQMMPQVLLHRRIHRTNMGRQAEAYQRTAYLRILKAGLVRKRSAALSHE